MPKLLPSKRLPMSFAAFVAGLALSLALGTAAQREILHGAQERFAAIAKEKARKVEDRFDDYTQILTGLRARFSAPENVGQAAFRDYVVALDLSRSYPGFRVVNFATFVRAQDRSAFEQALRADSGLPPAAAARLSIRPPGERAEYYPLTFIEPLAGNEALLGADLGAMPNRGDALERSRDTGELMSSGRRIQLGKSHSDVGLAMRLPVYTQGLPIETVEQRRHAYRGSVGAGFSVPDMMGDVYQAPAALALRLQLFDGGESPGPGRLSSRVVETPPRPEAKLVYDSSALPPHGATAAPSAPPRPAQERFVQHLEFQFGGHVWRVDVGADAWAFVDPLDRATPWLVALGGTAISALLAAILGSLIARHDRAHVLARHMTRELRASESQLAEAQRLAHLGSWELCADDGELRCSDEARRILELPRQGPLFRADLLRQVPADERPAVQTLLRDAACGATRIEFEHAVQTSGHGQRWVHVVVEPTHDTGRTVLRGVIRDDTQRRQSELRRRLELDIARLLLSDDEMETVLPQVLQSLCDNLRWDGAALWSRHDDGRIRCLALWSRPGAYRSAPGSTDLETGYDIDEGAFGRVWQAGQACPTGSLESLGLAPVPVGEVCVDAPHAPTTGLLVPAIGAGLRAALQVASSLPRGVDTPALEALNMFALQIAQYAQRQRAERQLRILASRDTLTGLDNRSTLQRELERAITRGQRQGERFAVMFVDLDRFKQINDTLGHGIGDQMLSQCGDRLNRLLREGDRVARFGGDEFVLLLRDLDDSAAAAAIALRVQERVAEPFVIEGHELQISASVGLSLYPDDGADAQTLLKNADTAMYRAKESGRGSHCFYTARMNEHGARVLALEGDLRRALERDELLLHYQPKLHLLSGEIVGVEALMRWRHPTHGMVSPLQFIPIAEELGLIDAFGTWALERACQDAAAWHAMGLPALKVSVNVSAHQFASQELVGHVRQALDTAKWPASLLELEITESAMMARPESAAAQLEAIRAIGVQLAIDDFGTGYSALSYLRRFPLTTVKIDRSFVKDLADDPDAQALVSGVVSLAHALRMQVVAEGVETADQLRYLRSRRCDEIQGYWLSKPLPADELRAFVLRHAGVPGALPIAA